MRQNWGALMGVAVVLAVGGAAFGGYGITTSRKRAALEKKRKQRCERTRKSGHWGKCCILCGGPGTDAKPVAVGSKHLYTIEVHVCREHLRIGVEKSYNLALEQRSPSYYALVTGAVGLLMGLVLGTILMLLRRRWEREEAL